MNRYRIFLPALAFFFTFLWCQDALAQVGYSERVQMQFHRAETAWRNQTSILEAKVRVDQVLRDAPNHTDAWKLRAEVNIAMQKYQDALRDAEQAISLNPEDGEAFLIKAEASRLLGLTERARGSLETAATLSIDADAEFHIKLSRSAVLLGVSAFNMAESFARVALAKDPDYAEAYYQLARVFLLRNREEEAVITLLRGFQARLLDPSHINSDFTLSQIASHERLKEFLQ